MAGRLHPWLVAVVTAVAAVALLAHLPQEVYWGPDGGNRFIQLRQFLRDGSLAIDDPAARIEPTGRLAPAGAHHFLRRGGDLYSFYAPWFSLATAPFYRLLGAPGLHVLPVGATLALIMVAGAMYRQELGSQHAGIAAAALIFASPLFFYTVVFWEHTLAVALSTAGIFLLMRSRPVAGGLLVASSAVFREEAYVALASLGVAMLFTPAMRSLTAHFALGALMALTPLWIANLTLYGHIGGLHGAIYADMHAGPRELAANFVVYLFRYTSSPAVQIAVAVPILALIVLAAARPFPVVETGRIVLLYTAAAGASIAAVYVMTNPRPVAETLETQALFGSLPWAAVMFVAPRRIPRFVAITIAAAVIITPLLLHRADIGMIWGPRHFLWLIPLLLLAAGLAAPALPRRAVPAVVLLLVATTAIHFYGLVVLERKLSFSRSLLETVRADDPEVIVSDVFWVAEELAALWFDKEMAFVRNDRELAWVIGRLKARGIRHMEFIASPEYRQISNAGFAPLLAHTTSRFRVGGSEPMLDAMVLRAELDAVREIER